MFKQSSLAAGTGQADDSGGEKRFTLRRIAIICAVGVCFAMVLGEPSATAGPEGRLTNAAVDLGASPPTVTLQGLANAFGETEGLVWQVVDGRPAALVVVSWTTGSIVAELASIAPGDYLVAVLPNGVPASQRSFFTLTVPGDNPDPPCFDDSTRFVDCSNGTVTDTVTGLIWLSDAICIGPRTYAGANAAASGLAEGRCDLTDGSRPGDWRLPTKEEWEEIVDPSCPDPPKIVGNGTPFVGCYTSNPWASAVIRPFYWSSTTDSFFPGAAWAASLNDGNVTNGGKFSLLSAWPVRGGQ